MSHLLLCLKYVRLKGVRLKRVRLENASSTASYTRSEENCVLSHIVLYNLAPKIGWLLTLTELFLLSERVATAKLILFYFLVASGRIPQGGIFWSIQRKSHLDETLAEQPRKKIVHLAEMRSLESFVLRCSRWSRFRKLRKQTSKYRMAIRVSQHLLPWMKSSARPRFDSQHFRTFPLKPVVLKIV